MTYEEWKKKRDEERATASSSKAKSTTQSGSESGKQEEQQETGYEAWKKRRQTQTQSAATDRVNQWLTEFRRFSDAYNARYRDKSQKYRSDSAYWLENVTKSQDRMRDMAQEISKYMEENRRILGNVFIARAEDMIWEGRKFQSSVVDQAREENDYYSQWENEDAFNLDMQKLQKREELLSFDTDAGQKEIDELKRRREELAQKNRKPASNYLTGGNDPVSTHYGAAMQNTKPGKEDEEIVELDRQISRKNQYLTQARRLQEADRLAGVKNSDDFKDYSGYSSTKSDDFIGRLTSKFSMGYDDLDYEYINGAENGMRDEIIKKAVSYDYDTEKFFIYDYMTEDQISIYNYHYAKDGKDTADKYLDSIRESLNLKSATERFQKMEDKTAVELLFGIEAGVDQWQSGIKNALGNRDGEYVAPSAIQMASGMVRQDLEEKSKVARTAYDLITTTSNMAPSILTSTVTNILLPGSGAVVGSAMMGMSSGGSAYQEMINEGYSKEQAKAYGTLVGASETVLGSLLGGISSLGGKLSGNAIGKLMSKVDNAVLRTAIKIGGNMVSEGLEEGLQEILTPWFKSVLTGEEYEVATEDVLYASLLGALSAGLLEGPTTISEARGISRQGAALKDAGITADRLAEIGKTFAADTVAYQLAGRVDGNTDAYTMGRLFNELDAELTRMNEDSIVDSLISKGVDERSARKLAEGFGAVVTGTPLTDRQKSAIAMNNVLAETVRETIIDPNSTVNQRSQGFNDLLHKLAQDQNGVTPESRQVVADTKEEASDPSRMAPQIPGQENVIAGSNPVAASNVDVQRGYEAPTDTDDGTGLIRQTVADMGLNESAANILVDAFGTDDSVDAETYATGIREAYRYGQFNYPAQEVAKGPFSSLLTEHQRNTAYKLGQMFGSEQATVRNNRTVQNGSGVFLDAGGGKVTTFSKKDLEGLNGKRRAGVEAAMLLKKLGFGNNYYFFESYENANGERVYLDENGVEKAAPNGWYDKGDGSIHIDLNAGANADGLTLYTLSHELTHFVENWSKDKYRELAGFLASNYGKNGSVDELVMAKKEELSERRGVEVSDEEAYSEFIADSMEAMLSDGNVLQKLTELKKTNRNLFDKIREFFGNLAKRITEFYKGAEPESEEGKAVLKMKDQIDQIQQMFAEALVDADENFQNATEIDLEVDMDTESVAPTVVFSERTWKESDYVQARYQAAKEISNAIGVSVKKAKDYIDSVNSIAKMIAEDRTRLDYFSSPGRSSFIGNVEYGGSFDFSTLCKKRRLLTGTFTAIQRALPNTALTADEILDIRNRMKEAGLEVSCGLCYVEGSRANMGQFAKEFLKLYKQYYPDAWQPNMADVNTPDGIEWVRINHPECYEQYEYFWNHYGTLKTGDKNLFASQQKPKLYQLHTEYQGEILKKFKGDDTVEEKNLNGGIRLQSFSDFEIVHLIDTMQIIMDMSRVGLAGQAYTKVPDFAWALGDTGLKINLSLIAKGVDSNGKLIFDDVEGMSIDTAVKLRDRYSKNVGTILVAFNDEQLIAAMADDRVDFIIPFHRSQWKKSQYAAMGLPSKTKDYTFMQNEKFIKPQYHEYRGRMVKDKAVNYMPNEYWDFSKSGKENAEAYLEMCARNNKRPKFYKLLENNGDGSYSLKADGSTDGYWKLLIDFKMYDNEGNGSPQMPVKPDFNMEEATRMLNDYKGGHSSFPVAQGIVDEFVKGYKQKNGGRQFSDRKKAVDNSVLTEENEVRGEEHDNSRIRKGTETGTAGSGNDRRADSGRTGYAPKTPEWRSLDRGVKRKVRSVIKTHLYNSPNINEALAVIYSYVGRTDETITEYTDRKAMDILSEKLYTAALTDHPVVFESNWAFLGGSVSSLQKNIKSATQSSLGSERQFSDRSTESASNRSLLVNAFEGVAKDDTERKKIREYRENVDGLNAQEKKLQELRKEIRELSFAKGKRDKAKLRQLQDEAIKTANRIDVYDKRLLRLEAAKPLQNVLEREKQKAYQKAKQKHNEAMDAYRQKMVESQNEIVKRYQDARAKGIESRAKTAMRHKIQGVVKELNQYLLKGTKDKHVMEGLRKTVAEALDVVNMDTVGAEERIAKLERELMNAKTPEAIQEISRRIDNVRRMGDRMSDRLKALKDAYREIAESNDPLIANSHDEVIEAKMESVIENVGDTPLRDMNLNQLEEVYDMYRMVMTTIRNANKAFKAAKGENIADLGSRVMAEVEKAGGKRKYSTAAMESVRKFGWNNLKPVYTFEHIGSNTLTQVFDAVRAGEDVWAKDVTDAKDFYRDEAKKHKYNSWDFRKRYSFTSSSGMDFDLNLEQIMSLYAYSKREQAADHLTRGGIVFDESTEVTMKTKLGIPVKFNPTEATAYNLSAETLGEIVGKLTEEQKAFVDEMQDYLSTTMGAKGNEVSMELYGIKLFKEKFYFPLKSATQFMAKAKEQQQGEVKIKNSGFSKETVKKANNPIVLTPFMDVWTSHVNEMSMYHAFVLPMEDFYRVWSYRTATSDTAATESVEMTVQNAYGKGATKYIDQMLKDLNGGARTDSRTGIINTMMGKFKKGAVFASLSVVVQQPSAIARAAALMDTKYFIGPKVDHKRHKALWNEVKQYAPVAIIKEMGYFDTNMGKTTKDFIVSKEYSSISEKMKALVTDSNYRDEVLSKAPALADEIAWCSIWEAVKRETKAKHPGMDIRSEAFLKKVGERFTEVVTRTQVYDSVLSRSANMRSTDTGMKMATAFMAEPTTSINMIADALLKAKRGDTKYARKSIGAVVASQLLNSILVSFVYAARDDDEDETYAEKYVGSLVGEFADSLNPAGYIPFIKDIMSIVQGYDVERSDMAVISDLWNAWQKLDSDNLSVYRKVEGFAGSICQIFGLPVKNIMRDVRGVYQAIDSFVNGQQTTKAGIGYAVKGAISGKTVSDQQQLYEAYLRGDQTQIDRVESRYKDQSAVDSAIRKALRENDPRIRAAAEARINGDIAEYTRIAKEIVAEKHFSQDNVVAAINAEINTMNKGGGSSTTTTQKETGLYKMSDFEAAVIAGDATVANAIRNDIIQTAQKNGKTVKEAEESFARSAGSSCRELFMDDSITKEQAIRILTTYCGKTREEADLQIQVYDWEKEVPGCDDITASAIREYNENCKNAGISKSLYYKAWSAYNDTDADYDENGDAIRNSKTQKVMRYINSLSLTKEQKTALAMCWYAESTVQKYKLW